MTPPRLQIPDGFRERLAYPKCAGNPPRMLVFAGQYWLDGACVRAGKALGWQVATVPVVMEGVLPRAALQQMLVALAECRPDFILSINLSAMDEQGLLAGLFEDLGVPLVNWFVDDPRTILMGRTCYGNAYSLALSWERAYLDDLRAAGFAEARWMPLAADLGLFDADPADDTPRPPAFLGNSMTAFAAREWHAIEARPALAAAVARVLDAGTLDRRRFGEGLEALFTADELAAMDGEDRRRAELYLFIEGTRRYRHAYVRGLADAGLVVHGDEGWREVTDHCGAPVHYMDDAPAFYRETAVNLNLTSIQMPAAVNQRVFDVPAAGGFLLTDDQQDLDELFAPDETARFSDLDAARAQLRHYLARPDERRAIAARARARILREHTYSHRLQAIHAIVRERWGPGA